MISLCTIKLRAYPEVAWLSRFGEFDTCHIKLLFIVLRSLFFFYARAWLKSTLFLRSQLISPVKLQNTADQYTLHISLSHIRLGLYDYGNPEANSVSNQKKGLHINALPCLRQFHPRHSTTNFIQLLQLHYLTPTVRIVSSSGVKLRPAAVQLRAVVHPSRSPEVELLHSCASGRGRRRIAINRHCCFKTVNERIFRLILRLARTRQIEEGSSCSQLVPTSYVRKTSPLLSMLSHLYPV